MHYQPPICTEDSVELNKLPVETVEIDLAIPIPKKSELFHYDKTGSLFIGDEPLRARQKDDNCRLHSLQEVMDEGGDDICSSQTVEGDAFDRIFTPTLKAEFVDYLVTQYFNSHAGTPQSSAQGNTGASSQGGTSSVTTYQQARSGGRGTGRRRTVANDDDDAQGDENTPVPRADVESDSDGRLLACPYYKWKPLTHKNCQGKVLKEISRLKLHLWRCHDIPIHCPVCFGQFSGEEERDSHVRARNCDLRDRPVWDCITADQKSKLKKRVDPKKSKSEHWFDIFGILFPGHTLPPNPWVEILLSAELVSLRNFISHNWQEVFDAQVEERIPHHLRSHSQAITKFSHQVFEDTVTTLLERFEMSQRPPSTPTIESSEATGQLSRTFSGSADAEASIPTTLTTSSQSGRASSPTFFLMHHDSTFQGFGQGAGGLGEDLAMAMDGSLSQGYDGFGSQFDDLFGGDEMAADSHEDFFDCL